jgi:hypothetical protein
MIRFERFPPKPYRRFGAIGFGLILSNDVGLRGVSIVMGFWQLNIGKIGNKPVMEKKEEWPEVIER